MSCYLIKVENGHKVARSITSEEEYKQLRGSNEQKANLRLLLVPETKLRKEDWNSLIIPAIIRKAW